MELWNFVVTTLANVPAYFESNPVLFVVVIVIAVILALIGLKDSLPLLALVDNPLLRAVLVLATIIGTIAPIVAGIAFTSANDIAQLRADMLTTAFFVEIAIVGIMFGVLKYIEAGSDDSSSSDAFDEAVDALGSVFFVIYSIVGAFVGTAISSWGFSIFGQTIGTWLFGAFLAWATTAIFTVAVNLISLPFLFLFGNPASRLENFAEGMVDKLGDEFDKPHWQRKYLKVILPTAVIVVGLAALAIAGGVLKENATIPKVIEDHVIVWNDEVLEAYVRYLLGMSEGDIWYHDVSEITEFDLSVRPNADGTIEDGPRITDISALANFTGLRTLNLRYQNVEDLSAVEYMEELTSLDILSTSVSDLTPLESCTKLDTLIAGDCNIEDLTPLAGLETLTILYLADNAITDIEPLDGLINLSYLNLEHNPIEDYSVLYTLSIDELYV